MMAKEGENNTKYMYQSKVIKDEEERERERERERGGVVVGD